MAIILKPGVLTTYSFTHDSFGHATQLVGGYFCTGNVDRAIEILREKRKQYAKEIAKKQRGLPYDKRFIGEVDSSTGAEYKIYTGDSR